MNIFNSLYFTIWIICTENRKQKWFHRERKMSHTEEKMSPYFTK